MMKAKNVIEKAKVTAMCAVPAIMACPLVAHAAGEATDAGSLADQAGQAPKNFRKYADVPISGTSPRTSESPCPR